MKYILLISVLIMTQLTYAQLPDVIGKEKGIMIAYCDSLMAQLHLPKKSMGKQNDFVLWDKGKRNVICFYRRFVSYYLPG
jgi:hypothetical protein